MNTGQLTLFTSEPPVASSISSDIPALPGDWQWVKLGDLCSIAGGGTPSRQVSEYFGGETVWLTPTEIDKKNIRTVTTSREYITTKGLNNSSARIISTGSILLTSRASIGYVAIAGCDLTTNQGFAAFTLKAEINNLFLAYWLISQKDTLEDKATGTTFKEISKAVLKTLEFPLPPLAEQHRIVARIEELFSEIGAGVMEIEAALKRLKTYRQAVLHHFLNNDKWERVKLCEVANSIQIGPFGTQLHQHDYITGGIPLVNPTHIKKGKIVPDDDLTVSEEKYVELSNYYLQAGDTIMGRRGEMARCALVTVKESGWLCGTGSLFVRPNLSLIEPQFLAMLLGSSATKNYLEQAASGSTMSNLNLKILNNTPILFPDLETQTRVVLEIEARLSEADVLERTLRTELQRAGRLRQSVLKHAFAGDPTFRRLIPAGQSRLTATTSNNCSGRARASRSSIRKATQTYSNRYLRLSALS